MVNEYKQVVFCKKQMNASKWVVKNVKDCTESVG